MDYYGYRSILDSLAKGIKRLPSRNVADYTVESMGSAGHNVIYRGQVVGVIKQGKAKDAVAALLAEQDAIDRERDAKKTKAAEAKPASDAKRRDADMLKAAMAGNKALIANAHKAVKLAFKPLSLADFRAKETLLIHASKGYGRRSGSEYRLVAINGEPAYARESDHWGKFHTSDFVDGEQVSKDYEWMLSGVTTKYGEGIRYAGYILLKDLKG
jgi:hypothetical protein